jgi:hypothetical protein
LSDGAWIETATGRRFSLLDPKPDEICIEDVAHSLSMQCRFTGHIKGNEIYSVAQHSLYVSHICSAEDAAWGLLHDASEAYCSDLSRPLKHCTPLAKIYKRIEGRIMAAICRRFGLPLEEPASVRFADCAMLLAEKEQLMCGPPLPDAEQWAVRCGGLRYEGRIDPMPPRYAKEMFLYRFRQLFPKDVW